MDNSLYQVPQSTLISGDTDNLPEFYIVSGKKFVVLFLLTLGFYSIYWFYQNWKIQKQIVGDDIWPVARGIFNIFFAHSLFEHVHIAIENAGKQYQWRPALLATGYVIMAIVGRVCDRLSAKEIAFPYVDILSIFALFFSCYILLQAQKAINYSQGDVPGKHNSRFTIVNVLWCIPGTIIWGMLMLGILVELGVIYLST